MRLVGRALVLRQVSDGEDSRSRSQLLDREHCRSRRIEGDGDRSGLSIVRDGCLEAVDGVRGVCDGPDPAVRVGHTVGPGHHVPVAALLAGLGVPGGDVVNRVAEGVLRVKVHSRLVIGDNSLNRLNGRDRTDSGHGWQSMCGNCRQSMSGNCWQAMGHCSQSMSGNSWQSMSCNCWQGMSGNCWQSMCGNSWQAMSCHCSQSWEGVKGVAGDWDGVEGGEGSGVVECLECRDSSQGVEGQEVVMGEHSPSQEVSRSSHARDGHGRHQHHGLGHKVSSQTNTTNNWDTQLVVRPT